MLQGVFYAKQLAMILKSELYPIGYVQKTHGIRGELAIMLSANLETLDFEYFVFEIDGIFVPFFTEDWRFRTNLTALLKLQGIDTDKQSKELVGKTIYIASKLVPKGTEATDADLHVFTGYTMVDELQGEIGVIQAIDDSTENLLFDVLNGTHQILIPAVDEWIIEIDDETKILRIHLPEGLLQINDEE
jgi:16S rRNA processing protein RimM